MFDRSGDRVLRIFFAAALFAASPARCAEQPGSTSADRTACVFGDAEPVVVDAVDEALDVVLDDGRKIALAGLEFPSDSELRGKARTRLQERVGAGRLAFLALASNSPNRWGRRVGGLFVAGEEGEAALAPAAEILLRAGLARFRPDAASAGCRENLLAAEEDARKRKLGLWANGEYVVLDAGRRDLLSNRKGMVLVEGVVSGTGEAGGSLYVNFGPRRSADFAVLIWRRNLEMFERAGLSPRSLVGRRVRVRGLIDTSYFGPRMEIATPAQIELVDAPVAR